MTTSTRQTLARQFIVLLGLAVSVAGQAMRFVLTIGVVMMSVNALAQGQAPAPAPRPSAPPRNAGTVAGAPAVNAGQDYDAAIARARALLKESKFKEAIDASEQAIKQDDKRWEGYVTAASAYSSQQLFDDAVGMLQSALTRAPEDRKPLIRDALAETRRALSSPLPQPAAANPAAPAGSATMQAEIVLWKSIENSTKTSDFTGYLTAYPNGAYAPVAKARLDALNEVSKTPQQKLSETIAKIVALSNNITAGGVTQNVFAAGCVLSVVSGRSGAETSTIDLRLSHESLLKVTAAESGSWEITGLYSLSWRPRKGSIDAKGPSAAGSLRGADQASVSQLLALLPDAIHMCRASAPAAAPANGRGVDLNSKDAQELMKQFEGLGKSAVPAIPTGR